MNENNEYLVICSLFYYQFSHNFMHPTQSFLTLPNVTTHTEYWLYIVSSVTQMSEVIKQALSMKYW